MERLPQHGKDFIDGRLAATELACAILIEHLATDNIKADLIKRLDGLTRDFKVRRTGTLDFRTGFEECVNFLLQRTTTRT